MCDLFAMSAPASRVARKALPVFGLRARNNVDGWGIGYFSRGRARVEKSPQRVYAPGHLHESFQRLARVITSPIIISHIRKQTSGILDECHAHPFVLNFRGTDWLFVHNGTSRAIESFETRGSRIEDAISDSARTFEFIRDRLSEPSGPGEDTLFGTLAGCLLQMLETYPGKYNIFLANPRGLFAFSNHRRLMLLKGSKTLEGELLVTTISQGLSDEGWVRLEKPEGKRGILLFIAGGDVVLKGVL